MSCEFVRTVNTPLVRATLPIKDCGCGCRETCKETQPKTNCSCGESHNNNFMQNPFGYPFMPMNINVNNSPTTTSNRSETISNAGVPVVQGGEVIEEQPTAIQHAARRIVKRVLVEQPQQEQEQVIEERVIGSNIRLEPKTKRKLFAKHTVPTWY